MSILVENREIGVKGCRYWARDGTLESNERQLDL